MNSGQSCCGYQGWGARVEWGGREPVAPGRERAGERHDPCANFGSMAVQPHGKPGAGGLSLRGEHVDRGVDPVRRGMQRWGQNDVAAPDRVLGHALPRKVQRTALAGKRFCGLPVLRMDAAHAGGSARTITVSSSLTRLPSTMPVTTVTAPERVKLRSTAKRRRPALLWAAVSVSAVASALRKFSIPSPVTAETAITGAWPRPESESAARISAVTSARRGP